MDKNAFVPPAFLARQAAPTLTLTCYCCGAQYLRGHYVCCVPPPGMKSDKWLAKHCKKCTGDPLRSHCPKHCTCPKPIVHGVEGFAAFRDTSVADELEQTRILQFPSREPGAEG